MSQQDMREFWVSTLNLPLNQYNYNVALEIYNIPIKAAEALAAEKAKIAQEAENKKWLMSIAIAFFIQRNGAQIINGITGGISGIVAGWLGLSAIA